MQDSTNENTLSAEEKAVAIVPAVAIAPAIIAALIAAATTAASATASSVATAIGNDGSSDPIACVFMNNTPDDWYKVDGYGQPVHGEILVPPASKVLNIEDGAETVNTNDYKENNNTGWALKSNGAGSEILIVFQNKVTDQYAAFYAKNPYSGAPEAGVSLSDGIWFRANQDSNDPKGKWMIDHIRNVSTDLCQFGKNGVTKSVQIGKFKVTFQAARDNTRFDMSYADYQTS